MKLIAHNFNRIKIKIATVHAEYKEIIKMYIMLLDGNSKLTHNHKIIYFPKIIFLPAPKLDPACEAPLLLPA